MTNVIMETTLNSSAENVWKTVSDFNGLSRFIPAIVKSTTAGTGIGAVRTLTLDNGAQIVEKLESMQETLSRSLSYSIISSPLPLEDYFATIQVLDSGDNQCKVIWSSKFEPKETSEKEAQDIIKGIYKMGFDGLKELFGNCS